MQNPKTDTTSPIPRRVPSFKKTAKSKLISPKDIIYDQDVLGKGGFGIVRKAVYAGEPVAVKSLLIKENTDSLARTQLFLQEARKMSELNHPRIVKFYGFILETCSLVLEFMPDGTLGDYIIRQEKISWKQRKRFAADIAEGMAYLHSKTSPDGKRKADLFHQDLKTANVLLKKEDGWMRCKLTDFGLSVLRREAGKSTLDRNTAKETSALSYVAHKGGTEIYMAPELKKTRQFTKACDVYAYGVVLLEIGIMEDPNIALVVIKKQASIMDNIPEYFKSLIINCLSADPKIRPSFVNIVQQLDNESLMQTYETMHEVLNRTTKLTSEQQISYSMSSMGVEEPEKPPRKRCALWGPQMYKRWNRKQTLRFLLVLLLFILGLVGVSIYWLISVKNRAESVNSSTLAALSSATSTQSSLRPVPTFQPESAWAGVSSFDLFAASDTIQKQVLNNLKAAKVSIVRIHIETIAGTLTEDTPDVEPFSIGEYNDEILQKIDALMVNMKAMDMKLVISPHSRLALGCYTQDLYYTTFALSNKPLNCDGRYRNDVTQFYQQSEIIKAYDRRLEHILQHKNPYMDNQPWSSLSSVIYAFEIQSQAEAFLPDVYPLKTSTWMCDRATKMRALLDPKIKISTGAAAYPIQWNRLNLYECSAIDVISLGDQTNYKPASVFTSLTEDVDIAIQLGKRYSKTILFGHFNSCGNETIMEQYLNMIQERKIPWIVWQVQYAPTPASPLGCDFYINSRKWTILQKYANEL